MATTKFLKAEAGKQTALGTPATPDFQIPMVGEYEDAQIEVSAEWDSGTWSGMEIVEQAAKLAKVTLRRHSFFEFWPVLLSAGFNDQLTASAAAPYSYVDLLTPTAAGTPRPYTFRFGATGNNIGGTGPAVQVPDAYLQKITLSGNMNSKDVDVETDWFGSEVDDNSGAGYSFAGAALPTPLGMMNTMLGALALKDAGTTGGDFTSLTSLTGVLLDWVLTIETGLSPEWSSDSNQLTYTGVRVQPPTITFAPTIRTNATTYAATRTKFEARTYQELMLTLTGGLSRQAILRATGRWTAVPTPRQREDGQVVITPVFTAETPETQTTTPHYFGWTVDTRWSHSVGDHLAQEAGAGAVLQENGLLIRILGT